MKKAGITGSMKRTFAKRIDITGKAILLLLAVSVAFSSLCFLSSCSGGEENESETTVSEKKTEGSESESLTEKITEKVTDTEKCEMPSASEMLSLGIYHLNLSFTDTLGTSEEDRIKELRASVDNGYCNTVMIEQGYAKCDALWDLVTEYDLAVWFSVYDFFDSSKTNIDDFISEIDKNMEAVRKSDERMEHLCGFFFDEPILRGESNEDYLTMTKTLYERYGKRNFICMSTAEFTDYQGNEQQLGMSDKSFKKILTAALKYTTDAAFDSYSYDVRKGKSNGSQIKKISAGYPDIKDGKSYYRVMTGEMLKRFDHDVNVWFFPCAYTTYAWGGYRADEAYCVAQLEFFKELLNEQKYKGGLFLYTYMEFSSNDEIGLRRHLSMQDENGKELIFKDTPKWKKYSRTLKKITGEFRETYAEHADYAP